MLLNRVSEFNIGRYASKALLIGILATTLFAPAVGIVNVPYAAAQETPAAEPTASNSTDSGCAIGFAECLAEVVYLFTVGIGSAAAYVGAWFFSLATALSLHSTAYALTFITEGWTTMRDLANMFFVLILVYIALTIMFRANTHDTAKKLAWVIVIALVINFSFFFTRVVIDAGNLLAIQFYNAIPSKPLSETVEKNPLMTGIPNEITKLTGPGTDTKDLTANIMEGVGVHGILGSDAFDAFRSNNGGLGGFFSTLVTLSFLYIVVGAMMFMLAAAFLTVGIKFIVRIAVLWLVIIASPLALVANTLQEGKKYYQQWQDALIKHAFYPAVFLFIFYILTELMEDLTKGGTTTILEDTLLDLSKIEGGGLAYLAPMIAIVAIRLGFVIALLYIGLQVSEKMGVAGSKFAQGISGRAQRLMGGASLGGVGWLGRNTVGYMGLRGSQSATVRNLAAQTGVKGLLGGGILRTGKFFGQRSYDARSLRTTQAAAAGIGLDLGKGAGVGGYEASLKSRVAKKIAFAGYLEPSDEQIEAARRKAIEEMAPADRVRLALAAKAYNTQMDLQKAGLADKEEVKEARKAYTDLLNKSAKDGGIEIKGMRFSERVKQIAGVDNKKELGKTLETKSARNFGFIMQSSRVAASQIRGLKKDDESKTFQNYIKEKYGDVESAAAAAPTAVTVAPADTAKTNVKSNQTALKGHAIPQTMQQHKGVMNNMSNEEREIIRNRQYQAQRLAQGITPGATPVPSPRQNSIDDEVQAGSQVYSERAVATDNSEKTGTQLRDSIEKSGKETAEAIREGLKHNAEAAEKGSEKMGETLGKLVRTVKEGTIESKIHANELIDATIEGQEIMKEGFSRSREGTPDRSENDHAYGAKPSLIRTIPIPPPPPIKPVPPVSNPAPKPPTVPPVNPTSKLPEENKK
ncbi:MAG: hypothetical protein KBD50_03415 [Candidatus Pacebacteria bacterium]|nr:hypothetical protein [Candidatus Paceibacterota bacterium]